MATSGRHLFTSESVTEGHPDKMPTRSATRSWTRPLRTGFSVYLDLAYLPSPDKVVAAFFNSFEQTEASLGTNMWGNIAASLQRFGIGLSSQ